MRAFYVISALGAALSTRCEVLDRQPLSFAPVLDDIYIAPNSANVTTLFNFIKSREDLSILASVAEQTGGFVQALNTTPGWQFTFFAPSNTAFNNTGQYFETYAKTAKGKWWLGNLIQHHYVPNTQLELSKFSRDSTRIQTGSFLYIGTQLIGDTLMLNNVSTVTEGDIEVTNGLVHIIDHILDPAAQVFEPDIPKTNQNFIAGSCSNPDLPYC